MSILIGADLVPTKSNMEHFENERIEKLLDKNLIKKLSEVDYRIFNLEVPLTNIENPIDKCGPNLIATTKSGLGLRALGVDFLTLANNHILDQGVQGAKSTLNTLKELNISFAGVGENIEDASKPHIFEIKNKKIGVYCCAEHEFSIVSENKFGANPFDPLQSLDHINSLATKVDYVVVLYHGGKEHYRYPSPNLQKICRKVIEKGADLVICQHTHCIGSEEKWRNGTIVYGQGNFIFDDSESEFWKTSLLINIKDNFEIDYIPIVKTGYSVKLADEKSKEEILKKFYERSQQIKQEGFVEKEYEKYSREIITNYLYSLAGVNRWIKGIDKYIFNGFFIKKFFCLKKLLILQNYIECEAHRELLLKGLEKRKDEV